MNRLSSLFTVLRLHPAWPQPPARHLRSLRWVGIGVLFLFGVVLALLDPCI